MARKQGDKIFPKLSDKVIPGRVKAKPSVELGMLREIGAGLKVKKTLKKARGLGLRGHSSRRK